MKRTKKIGLGIIVTLVISVVYALIFTLLKSGTLFHPDFLMIITIIITEILVLGGLGVFIFRRFSKSTSIELKKRLLPSFIIFVVLSLILSLILQGTIFYVFTAISGKMQPGFIENLINEIFPDIIKQLGIWILVVAAFFLYSIWNESIKRELKLNEELSVYKYQRLKSQLSPHFLFNSLNALSELIYEDVGRADSFVQGLSKMYRYILENEETDFISLQKELDFIESYVNLQKGREKDKVSLVITVQNPELYSIIPLSLQLLIENALKHNARSIENPLIINVFLENNYIVVSNRVQIKNIIGGTTRKGLKNLSERIKLTMNNDLIIRDENNVFLVKIPLIVLPK